MWQEEVDFGWNFYEFILFYGLLYYYVIMESVVILQIYCICMYAISQQQEYHRIYTSYLQHPLKQMLQNNNLTKYLTNLQIKQAKQAFKIFDQDNSGSISIRQFDQILKSFGQNLTEEQLDNVINKIDRDGNGYIDFDQFLYLVAPKIIDRRSERAYIEAFKMLDYGNKGGLGLAELQRANMVTGANLQPEELNQIIQYVSNKFGKEKISIDVMLTMLQRKPQIVPEED